MKKLVLSVVCLFSLAAQAELNLKCSSKYNLEDVFQSSFKLNENQKNLNIGSFNEFEVLISSMGGNKVELQIYNANEPSRSYANSVLNDASDMVELVIWKRDFMFETKCQLAQ